MHLAGITDRDGAVRDVVSKEEHSVCESTWYAKENLYWIRIRPVHMRQSFSGFLPVHSGI